MRAPAVAKDFLAILRRSGLLDEGRWEEFLQSHPNLPSQPGRLASLMVRSGFLTKYQAQVLLAGRWKGLILGSYRILKPIGKGGGGTVFLAEHTTMLRKAAIKVLPRSRADSPGFLDRFYREGRAAAALDHPNLVRAYDIGKEGDVHYLVMEYVEGQDLAAVLQEHGRMEFRRAAACGIWAASGLQHAVEKGLIHRDIKPANLMLTKQGSIKILDMGLARFFQDTTDQLTKELNPDTVICTPDFASPEQSDDPEAVDIRSDVYSLGCTLYTLVTGTTPFTGTITQKLLAHQNRPAMPVHMLCPDIPEGFGMVIAKMMAKLPSARYQTPIEVVDALSQWAPWAATKRQTEPVAIPEAAPSMWTELAKESPQDTKSGTAEQSLIPTIDVPFCFTDPDPSKVVPTKTKRKRWVLGVGFLAVVGLTVAGWYGVQGTAKDAEKSAKPQTPSEQVRPPAVPVPWGHGRQLVRLDLRNQGYFSGEYRGEECVKHEGRGTLPAGWTICSHTPQDVALVSAEQRAGESAICFRSRNGQGVVSFALAGSVPFTAGRGYLVRLGCAARGNAEAEVLFRFGDHRPTEVVRLSSLGEDQRLVEWPLTTHQPPGDRLTLEIRLPDANAEFQLFSLEVLERTESSRPPTTLYTLEAGGQKPFAQRIGGPLPKEGITSGEWPKDWNLESTHPNGMGEVTLETIQNTPVFAIRNLGGSASTRWTHRGSLQAVEGGRYRLIVEYRTSGNTAGEVIFAGGESGEFRRHVPLTKQHESWKRVEADWEFHQPVPLKVTISNHTPGEQNTLYIRRIAIEHCKEK